MKNLPLLIAIFLISSCARDEIKKDCAVPTTDGKIIFSGFNDEMEIPNQWVEAFEVETMYYGKSLLSGEKYNQLLNLLGLESINNTFAFVIYLNDINLATDLRANESNLFKVGVYYLDDNNKSFHKLFRYQSGELVNVDNRNFSVGSLTTNIMSFLTREGNTSKGTKSFILVRNLDFDHSVINWQIDEFLPVVLKSRDLRLMKTAAPETCGPGCFNNPENSVCDPSPHPTFPDACNDNKEPPICPETAQHDTLVSSNLLTESEAASAYNFSLHSSFRDDFLFNYSKGIDYINYYYNFGLIMKNNNISVPLSLMVETAGILIDINPSLNKLLNSSTNGSEIVIDLELSSEIQQLLLDYRALSNNSYWINTIDLIIVDVQAIEGLTVNQVIAYLN